MNLRQGLLCVTMLAALSAHAMDGAITKEEFDQSQPLQGDSRQEWHCD